MKIKSLITTFAIVAATSSVAFAKPAVSFEASASWSAGSAPAVRDHRTSAPVVVRDHRTPAFVGYNWARQGYRPGYPPGYEQPLVITNTRLVNQHSSEYIGSLGTMGRSWGMIALTEPTRIDQGRQDFIIRQGGFDSLQLRATAGSSRIDKVTIEFMDESAQVVQVNQTLDRRNPTITIDIKGCNRQVKRIFVYGATAHDSAYQLFAS